MFAFRNLHKFVIIYHKTSDFRVDPYLEEDIHCSLYTARENNNEKIQRVFAVYFSFKGF